MKRLREKLQSQSGASILMALLLFLVCVMVSASILAASVSNAGKARSNRVEQQKYLTLSSAIRLVADELQQAQYFGKYKVYEWENNEGTPEEPDIHYYYHIEQAAGDYSCGVKRFGAATGTGELTDQLPLGDGLDQIFSKQFTGGGAAGGSTECTLKVKLPAGLKGYPYETSPGPAAYKISDTVTVQVKLDHATSHITLTAWFGENSTPPDKRTPPEDKSNTMIAELIAKEGTAPKIRNADIPAGKERKALPDHLPEGVVVTETETTLDTPMQWELSWIKKGVAE